MISGIIKSNSSVQCHGQAYLVEDKIEIYELEETCTP
jgi:hypothetical protein